MAKRAILELAMADTTSPTKSAAECERFDWSDDEIREIHDLSIPDLIFRAQEMHRRFHDPRQVQLCTLLSIKTGGCPEDCAYCPQSAHHDADLDNESLLNPEVVRDAADRVRSAPKSYFL